MNAREVAEINERRRRQRGEDHDQPYAPVPDTAYKLAAVIPVTSPLRAYAGRPDDMYRAYWRRREFNQRRHSAARIWPAFHLFRRQP